MDYEMQFGLNKKKTNSTREWEFKWESNKNENTTLLHNIINN